MQTEVIKADNPKNTEYAAQRAAQVLGAGQVVAIPTETVYGLACSALDKTAAEKVFAVKGRPQDNPLIVHIADFSQIYDICEQVPERAKILADKFLPGPLTLILKKKPIIPDFISAGLPTVAVRIPSHPVARAIIRAAGVPLAAPSANLSGKPSTTTAKHVIDDLSGKIPLIIDGGNCDIGLESTILDLTVEPPAVLRPGGISPEQISAALGEPVRAENNPEIKDPAAAPKAPGMKYRHYAPSCPCTAVCGSPALSADYIAKTARAGDGIICFDRYAPLFSADKTVIAAGGRERPELFARELFDALRRLDEQNAGHIYIQCPPVRGIGLAVMNRVRKSSSGDVVTLHSTRIIGVSGRSGSGKSVISRALARFGAMHIDCDAIYYELLREDADMRAELNREFGQIVSEDGKLDRQRLSQVVFADPSRLKRLNEITHPFVIRKTMDLIDSAERDNLQTVVIDAPLLFECSLAGLCDITMAAVCDDDTAVARICKRDGISPERARKRIDAQRPNTFFADRADMVIKNNGDPKQIEEQLFAVLEQRGIKVDNK